MTRLHLHITVDDLDASINFYRTLFNTEPSVRRDDYAKFMLEDPRINLALGQRSSRPGIDHVGIQVDSEADLAMFYSRLAAADAPTLDEGEVDCCYAQSRKSWISDPSGVSWEIFQSLGEAAAYGSGIHSKTAPVAHAAPAQAEPTADLPRTPACC